VNHTHVSLRARPNASTCLPHQFREVPLDAIGLEHAYHRAKEVHAERPVVPGTLGYRIVWSFGERVGSVDLPALPGAYVIVGRHSNCDVVLDSEPTLALRHLLMRAVVLADGTVGVRILDLRTSLGFIVDAGGPCRSIFAVGPIAIRLGPYAIIALPLDPRCVPPQLPRPTLSRGLQMPTAMPVSPYRVAPAVSDRSFRSSHVTILPAAPALEDLNPTRQGFGRLTLVRGWQSASIDVDVEELESGILVGRADKCVDHGLRALLDASISRAHLLLVREEGHTSIFDLCSTQGTYVNGVRVRRYPLAEMGAPLSLGQRHSVHVHWRSR